MEMVWSKEVGSPGSYLGCSSGRGGSSVSSSLLWVVYSSSLPSVPPLPSSPPSVTGSGGVLMCLLSAESDHPWVSVDSCTGPESVPLYFLSCLGEVCTSGICDRRTGSGAGISLFCLFPGLGLSYPLSCD